MLELKNLGLARIRKGRIVLRQNGIQLCHILLELSLIRLIRLLRKLPQQLPILFVKVLRVMQYVGPTRTHHTSANTQLEGSIFFTLPAAAKRKEKKKRTRTSYLYA
uniref:Uncharacterized protein n=1 Tax=Erythrolobus australicus TaxID=1077150 RepID=A0A7S1XJM0_9RHOD